MNADVRCTAWAMRDQPLLPALPYRFVYHEVHVISYRPKPANQSIETFRRVSVPTAVNVLPVGS